MNTAAPSSRKRSLGFGIAYIAGGVWSGFNLGFVWDLFAPDGLSGQGHHLISILTTVFPHVLAITGFALLIAGQRLSSRAFAAIALIPALYTIGCLVARAWNLQP